MTAPNRTRYQPIADHLATITVAEIVLTFAEIEAFVSTAYWTTKNRAHVRAWEQLGWHARVDRHNRRIHFTRAEG